MRARPRLSQGWIATGPALVGLYLSLALSSCSGSPAESTAEIEPTGTPASSQTRIATPLPSQLYVILADEPVPVENGEQVELSEDLDLQITVDPYPPHGLSAHAVVDLHLTRPGGRPVDNAQIEVRYDMFTMVHGPFEPQIIARDDGHYLFSLEMIMYGAWELNTAIRVPNDPTTHQLTIAVILTPP